ncbi:MAG: energy transducer TonB [Methylophilaceae bacterium]|nr:energy transducer TonB [Methylophilaceae bacterium]
MSIELVATKRIQKRDIAPQANRVRDAANDAMISGKLRSLNLPGLHRVNLKNLNWQQQGLSPKVFAMVVAIHVAVLAGIALLSPIEPVKTAAPEPAAMLVSLVNDLAPEPTPEVIDIILESKPVVKKTKSVKKVVEPTPVPEVIPEPTVMATEPEIAMPEPVMASAPAPVAKQEAPVVKEPPVIQEVVEPPRFGAAYLHNPAPSYPAVSRRIGEEGRVMLRVLVSKSGDAEQVEIESGSGFTRLDKAALDAVKKWRFIPAKRNNQPISAYVIVPIQFTLNS